MMQTVSGIHYNFSFNDKFFDVLRKEDSLQNFKNKSYLSLIRNFRRYAWMILTCSVQAQLFQKRLFQTEEFLART